ncbi:MAG: DUF1428 domain-containing protein [Pseudomonadota bacterium]
MSYIDGFLAPVKTDQREAYTAFVKKTGGLMREYGALSYVEAWGDDVPPGKVTSMPMAVKAADDETVVFSWVIWPSKEVRDAGWARMMEDPRMKDVDMPFDGKRMILGGFTPIAEG